MYAQRIAHEKIRNPCLSDLHEFIRQPALPIHPPRVVSLNFVTGGASPEACEITPTSACEQLCKDVEVPIGTHSNTSKILGRVLIIEYVSKELVEDLGTKLDIDPWFFASYIYQAWRNTKTQSTQNCTIPSRERKQNFLALHYHRTLSFGTLDAQYVQLRRRSHHERKVFVIPAMSGERVGLAQHCCSILLVERPNQSWVCIILTDPEMDHQYTPGRNFGRLPVKIPSTPFLGGCEAFQTSNEREYDLKGQSGATKRGMLEDLVQYWTVSAPSMFDPCNPTLRAMAYYPLKIVAAEWVNYIAVMAFSLKAYELSMKPSSNLSDELIKLNFNLRNLQTWRRRVLSTQGKLRQAVRFIYRRQAVNGASENWDALWEDYQFIIAEIDNHGQRLEAMIPVVTSAVQLVESRRSLIATTNVSRLTVLALIFIPLTYVASIFSMSEQFGPGGSKFWVYFTVSVPITAIVVGIANPPKWVAEFVARRAVKDA